MPQNTIIQGLKTYIIIYLSDPNKSIHEIQDIVVWS